MAGKSAEYKLAIQIAGTIASSFNSSIGTVQSRLSALGNAAGTAMKAAAAASAAAAAAVGAFAAGSLKAGMEFDSSMSQVAATMGTTVDQIQGLREFAQEMGRTTAFSAREAAEGLNYMALAGYSAEDSMEMLPKVLNLAAAGSMELAQASDMVTDAQSALGLSAEQTGAMVNQKDNYDEYMIMEGALEQVGNTRVDLSGYAQTEQIEGDISAAQTAAVAEADANTDKKLEGYVKVADMVYATPEEIQALFADEDSGE